MKISRLRVRNCSAVHDLDLEVRRHLVLVGPNASGKSTLLRLVNACLATPTQALPFGVFASQLRDATQQLVVEVELDSLTDDERAALPDEIEVMEDGSSKLTVRMTASLGVVDPSQLDFARVFVKRLGSTIAMSNRHVSLLRWTYLRATRSSESELGSGRGSAAGRLLAGVDYADDRDLLDQTVADANVVVEGITALADLRRQVAIALNSVYPSDVSEAQVKISVTNALDISNSLNILLDGGSGDFEPLLNQSDGLRSLATLSLQRLAGGAASITAIDEPELHLHPRLQGRVARMLSTEDGQRIVATHAPAVVRGFEPSDVIALTTDGPRQLPANIVEANPKFFSQWWVDHVIEPLTSRSVALVEGPADETLFRAVASARGIDLDRQGVSVLSLGGAENFPNAYRLLGPGAFGLRVAALVDAAQMHLVAEVLGLDEGADADVLAAAGVFVAAPDLEGVYCQTLGTERMRQLLSASGLFAAGSIGGLSDLSSLLSFCGATKRKVLCAIAVARGLNATEADALSPLSRALDYLVADPPTSPN